MKILENHFEGKRTYVVGSWISNGCQTFHVDEAKEVFDEFKVPIRMQEEVLSYVNKDEDLTPYVNHEYWRVRVLVAKQGYGLDVLLNDECWLIRREVARQGYGLDILINDAIINVRGTAREYKLKNRKKSKFDNFIKNLLNIFKKKTT